MRIGIMLRHFDQPGGGVKNYTNFLLRELFTINSPHEFILIYNNSKHLGAFNKYENVTETAVNISSRVLWDQIGVPLVQKKEKIDIIFNPKYSLPLSVRCPTVFVCHGMDWYIMPWAHKWADHLSHKFLFPLYVSKASSIITVSETTKEGLVNFLNVDESKIHTVYHGVNNSHGNKISENELREIKLLYNLPDRFFLFAGQIYPPKNIGGLLQAYAKVGPKLGISLVIAGKHKELCSDELTLIDKLGISEWVVRPGWLGNHALTCTYKLAEALVIPSLYESFGMPIIEAMSVGCPVITSNRFGTKEIAGDAAVLVNPENIDSISEGMEAIAINKPLRMGKITKGYKRSCEFSWRKCAEETLDILENTQLSRANDFRLKNLIPQNKNEMLLIQRPERFEQF